MFIQTADAAGSKDGVICMDVQSIFAGCGNDALADAVFHAPVFHYSMVHDCHICKFSDAFQQSFCDFLTSDVLMEADTGFGMSPFFCIFQAAILFLIKIYTQCQQVVDDFSAVANHQVYAFLAVFVVACF